ncbi:hypothetical protein [Streptomyces sp. NPDC002176]|uniref:hypothetical protein n=1 Tax=Streptomyces sp. NPDC002176 TaxID=3364634 RepID=UPI00384B205E
MTVPMNPETPRSKALPVDEAGSAVRKRLGGFRARRAAVAAVLAVALTVVLLVTAFPRLAAPIGTAAGVVAVVIPLVQRKGRDESSVGGSVDEP